MKQWTITYEWYNAPSWHEGSFKISDFGHEHSLIAEAAAQGLRAHPRFRKVNLLLEESKPRQIAF